VARDYREPGRLAINTLPLFVYYLIEISKATNVAYAVMHVLAMRIESKMKCMGAQGRKDRELHCSDVIRAFGLYCFCNWPTYLQ
jgi:hypothetical protein